MEQGRGTGWKLKRVPGRGRGSRRETPWCALEEAKISAWLSNARREICVWLWWCVTKLSLPRELKKFYTRWNVSILRGNLHSRWCDRVSESKAKLGYKETCLKDSKTKMKDRLEPSRGSVGKCSLGQQWG